MGDKNLWIAFEKTGNIVDYLNYRGVYLQSEEEIGERAVESIDNRDRDGVVGNTYR